MRLVVSLRPARSPVVSTRATASTTPAPAVVTPGDARTPRSSGDTVKRDDSWVWKRSLFEGVFLFSIKTATTTTRARSGYDHVMEISGCEPNATIHPHWMLATKKGIFSICILCSLLTKYDPFSTGICSVYPQLCSKYLVNHGYSPYSCIARVPALVQFGQCCSPCQDGPSRMRTGLGNPSGLHFNCLVVVESMWYCYMYMYSCITSLFLASLLFSNLGS